MYDAIIAYLFPEKSQSGGSKHIKAHEAFSKGLTETPQEWRRRHGKQAAASGGGGGGGGGAGAGKS